MAWIEYHTALRDHWKIKRLSLFLEVDYLYALGSISCLWLWAAEYAKDGDLKRFSDAEIRDAARCNLQKFSIDTLKKCELINDKNKINDWNKHGLKLLESTKKRVREHRLRKRYGNVTVTPTQPTLPNQPNLTQPNQPIKEAQPSAAEAALKKVYNKGEGLNIYSLIGRISKERGWAKDFKIPDKIIIAVCERYLKDPSKVKDAWPWFTKALDEECTEYFKREQIDAGKGDPKEMPQSIKDIMAKCFK